MTLILVAPLPPLNMADSVNVISLPWLLGGTADFKKGRSPRWAWPNHNESLKVGFSLARGRRGSQRFKAHDRLDMLLLAWRWKRSESSLWDQRATASWQYARNADRRYMVARNWSLPIKWMLESVFSPVSRQELSLANTWISASWHLEQRSGYA